MLWIVGHAFRELREYLGEKNIPYGVFINAAQPLSSALQGVRTVPVDYSSTESLIRTVSEAGVDITVVLAAGYENYVLPAAILADHFGLPGLSLEAAHATTDKSIMRSRFRAYDTAITPDFAAVQTWDDIERFMTTHDYPVMLKPTNLMKSLFITKNTSHSQLRANFAELQRSLDAVRERIYTMDPPGIIIEECMSGSMHTVAGYADSQGRITVFDGIVDCITGQDIGKGENYIYSRQLPSALPPGDSAAVLDVARRGAAALGLQSTMLHIEIMLTNAGPKIIEIGARIGGYRTRMYDYATGLDMNGVMLDIAFGRQPTVVQTSQRSIAVIELFPDTEGRFADFPALPKIERLASFLYAGVKVTPGKLVGRSSHGYKASAVIILGNADQDEFRRDLAYVGANAVITIS